MYFCTCCTLYMVKNMYCTVYSSLECTCWDDMYFKSYIYSTYPENKNVYDMRYLLIDVKDKVQRSTAYCYFYSICIKLCM